MNNVKPTIRLMIVDDSKVMQKIIQQASKSRSGLDVVAMADNGIDAFHALKVRRPTHVTMDLTMPKLNGVDAIEKIREYEETVAKPQAKRDGRPFAPVKILVISSLNDLPTAFRALDAGAQGFLNKPFSDAELLAALNEL